MIVANLYGRGEIKEARRNAGVVLILTAIISIFLILLTILGVIPLLKALNFNRGIIERGQVYFYIQITTTALTAINVVFIGLERAKRNIKLIIVVNIVGNKVINICLCFGLNSIDGLQLRL